MSDDQRSLLPRLSGELLDFYHWLQGRLVSPHARRAVLADLGIASDKLPPPLELDGQALAGLQAYRDAHDPDEAAFAAALKDLVTLAESVEAYLEVTSDGTGAAADELVHRFLLLWTLDYLRTERPGLYWAGRLAQLIEETLSSQVDGTIVLHNLSAFAGSPKVHSKRFFSLNKVEDAQRLTYSLSLPLGVAATFVPHADVLFGWDGGPDSPTTVADGIAGQALTVAFEGELQRPDDANDDADDDNPNERVRGAFSTSLVWVPEDHGGGGPLVAMGGDGKVIQPLAGGWELAAGLVSATALDLFLGSPFTFNGPSDARVEASLERVPRPGEQPLKLGGRLCFIEIGQIRAAALASPGGAELRWEARDSALVVRGDGADSLLKRFLGGEEMRVNFNLALVAATGRGISIEGGAGLEGTFAINRRIGPLRVGSLYVALRPQAGSGGKGLRLLVAATIEVRLGPLQFSLDRLGYALDATLPDDFGDWRGYSLRSGYLPPTGVGVVVNASELRGGGYLLFDSDRGQYAGVLQLTFARNVALTAIGIVTTKMPDGRPGVSFLLILAVERMAPIDLGLGFRLTGLGGLIGADRGVSIDALRAGIDNDTLDRVLFPKDPVANASAVVSAVSAIFPPVRDRVIFGPMAQISWGAEDLVTIEVAVVGEFGLSGGLARLVIIGKLRASLKGKARRLIQINVNAFGSIDFERGRAEALAKLYDSRVGGLELSGNAAMLYRWRDDPTFLISFGGWNKRFTAPAEMPRLKRLAVAFPKNDGLKLKLEAYLAWTSNTIQIGGHLNLFAGKGKFTIEGDLAVDALIQRSPPGFVFDLRAQVEVKAWGKSLLMVRLEGTLSGPGPYHASGSVTFKIWFFSKSVGFSKTWGEDEAIALPTVDLAAELRAALADPRNWSAEVTESAVVTLREQAGVAGQLPLHPLGGIGVRQRVVPLGIEVERYGGLTPVGARRFTLGLRVAGDDVAAMPLRDYFARAEYFDLSDNEQLSAPSFEQLDAGVGLKSGELRHGDPDAATIDYETFVLERSGELRATEARPLDRNDLAALARLGAAGKRERRRAAVPIVRLASPEFSLVPLGGGTEAFATAGLEEHAPPTSYSAARQQLRRLIEARPAERGRWAIRATRIEVEA